MSKAWDIVGIKRERKKPTTATKKRSQNTCIFWLFIILVFLASAFFFGKLSEGNFTITPVKTAAPSSLNQTSPQNNGLLIEVLNGSGRFEETDKVTAAVKAAGFGITKTETSINSYDKTIIYYKSGLLPQANQIAAQLSVYKPTVQVFSQPSSYDIAIIIGSR